MGGSVKSMYIVFMSKRPYGTPLVASVDVDSRWECVRYTSKFLESSKGHATDAFGLVFRCRVRGRYTQVAHTHTHTIDNTHTHTHTHTHKRPQPVCGTIAITFTSGLLLVHSLLKWVQ